MKSNRPSWVYNWIGLTSFLILWELVGRSGWVDPIFISSPMRILSASTRVFSSPSLAKDVYVSSMEFGIGVGMSIGIGVPLGLLMGWYPRLRALVDPLMSALYATPRVALLPMIILWFGIDIGSKVAIVFLMSLFAVLINATSAVSSVNPELLRVARAFGARDRDIFRTVVLPSSVPMILSGIRIAVGQGLIGVVVGELYAATSGLGFKLNLAGSAFQTDEMFVYVVLIAMAGILMVRAVHLLEKRFDTWRGSTTN